MAFLKSAAPSPQRDAVAARNGARWFYWIAGLSTVNSIVAVTGGTFVMIFGLTSTLFATYLGSDIGGTWAIVGMVVAVLVSLGFLGLGWMAERGAVWAYAVGGAVYAADTVLTLFFKDWLSVIAHVFAVAIVFAGMAATQRLKKVSPPPPPEMAVAGAVPVVPGSPASPAFAGVPAGAPAPPMSDRPAGFAEATAPAPLD